MFRKTYIYTDRSNGNTTITNSRWQRNKSSVWQKKWKEEIMVEVSPELVGAIKHICEYMPPEVVDPKDAQSLNLIYQFLEVAETN